MLVDTRLSYTGNDKFEPEVYTRPSVINPKDMLVSVGLKSALIRGSGLVSHELHITMDLEKAKLIIAKLQEGVDQCEKETGV